MNPELIRLYAEIERLRSENKDLRMDLNIALADACEQSDIADEYLDQLYDARANIDILRNDIANLDAEQS